MMTSSNDNFSTIISVEALLDMCQTIAVESNSQGAFKALVVSLNIDSRVVWNNPNRLSNRQYQQTNFDVDSWTYTGVKAVKRPTILLGKQTAVHYCRA